MDYWKSAVYRFESKLRREKRAQNNGYDHSITQFLREALDDLMLYDVECSLSNRKYVSSARVSYWYDERRQSDCRQPHDIEISTLANINDCEFTAVHEIAHIVHWLMVGDSVYKLQQAHGELFQMIYKALLVYFGVVTNQFVREQYTVLKTDNAISGRIPRHMATTVINGFSVERLSAHEAEQLILDSSGNGVVEKHNPSSPTAYLWDSDGWVHRLLFDGICAAHYKMPVAFLKLK